MCQINTEPMVSQIGMLEVVEAPDILYNETSNDTITMEGASVSLRCEARWGDENYLTDAFKAVQSFLPSYCAPEKRLKNQYCKGKCFEVLVILTKAIMFNLYYKRISRAHNNMAERGQTTHSDQRQLRWSCCYERWELVLSLSSENHLVKVLYFKPLLATLASTGEQYSEAMYLFTSYFNSFIDIMPCFEKNSLFIII